jgi:microcystin-dependent protein
MSIQIIDNFKVNVSLPIDSKIVVGSNNQYQTKEDIEFKYDGLRIWDLNDNKSWVWYNNQWNLELTELSSSSGINNFVSKFQGISPSQTLVNSIIFDNGNAIGIDTVNIISGTKLQVNGIIRSTTGGFFGNGSNITNINANNITSGNLSLARLSGGGVGNILAGTATAAQWVSASSLFSNNIVKNSTNSLQFIIFSSGEGNNQLRINDNIRINPSNGNVSISTQSSNNKLTVNGSTSIGTTIAAPSNGLLVEGEVKLNTVNINNQTVNKILTIDSNNSVKYSSGGLLPIGTIVMWFSPLIPNGWVFCDGSSYNTPSGPIITPDLRERFIVCASSNSNVPGPGYIVGQTGGVAQVTLNQNQIPPHTHNLHGSVHQKNEASAIGTERLYLFPNGPSGGLSSTISSTTGSGQPHENRPPYFSLAFIMYIGNT